VIWCRSSVEALGRYRSSTRRVNNLLVDHLDQLRLSCAAKIAMLADKLREIPPDLAPCRRASLVAVREQI
jgi:hypothetical protein